MRAASQKERKEEQDRKEKRNKTKRKEAQDKRQEAQNKKKRGTRAFVSGSLQLPAPSTICRARVRCSGLMLLVRKGCTELTSSTT